MQRARMRARQNEAWRRVRSLAAPMLTAVKAVGSVPMAELLVSDIYVRCCFVGK